MLLVENNEPASTVCSGSRSPSILDSPTLARVQRARLRQEAQLHHTLSSYCPSLLSVGCGEVIKKGLLWQQRERLFSRWKERFFILTRDYLHCFKRSSRSDKISDMGQFIFKVKLVDVVSVEWINRKSYSIVALELSNEREPRILLRTEHDLESWFELLEECMMTSKERRRALRKYGSSVSTSAQSSQNSDQYINTLSTVRSNIHNWFSYHSPEHTEKRNFSDSVPDLTQIQARRKPQFDDWRMSTDEYSLNQRHSLLTDIDINSCDSPANSVRMSSVKEQNGVRERSDNLDSPTSRYASRQPYHFSKDVFFMASIPDYDHQVDSHFNSVSSSTYSSSVKSRPVLTPTNSFRNSILFPNSRQSHDKPLPFSLSVREQNQNNGHDWKYKTSEIKGPQSYHLPTIVQE